MVDIRDQDVSGNPRIRDSFPAYSFWSTCSQVTSLQRESILRMPGQVRADQLLRFYSMPLGDDVGHEVFPGTEGLIPAHKSIPHITAILNADNGIFTGFAPPFLDKEIFPACADFPYCPEHPFIVVLYSFFIPANTSAVIQPEM